MVNEVAAWMVAKVKSAATLADLAGRIFPDVAPEGAPNPCLVYQLIGDEHEAVMDPGMASHATLAWQLRCYGVSRSSANAVRDALRELLEGVEPQDIGGRWRIEGSGFGDLSESYEVKTKDFGALAVVEIHVGKR